MLSINSPVGLWLGLSIIPIIFFYFLRMRFRQQPISSIYLWSRLQNVINGDSRLRWRGILLLLLQLLTAAAAITAVAQPVWTARYISKPGVLYLLDISASMETTDINQNGKYKSRLEQARSIIVSEIKKQPRQTEIAVFLCAAGIKSFGAPTYNQKRLETALKTANLRSASFIQGAGFAEADVANQLQAWLVTRKKSWRAVLVTDGGLDLAGERLAKVFGGNLKTIVVGSNGNNIGVTALRLLPESKAGFQIHNGWPIEQSIKVVLEYNGQTIAGANLKAPPGISSQSLVCPGPFSAGIYQIRLAHPAQNLSSGVRYYLAVNKPRLVRVLLMGNSAHNPFIRAALNNPEVSLSEIASIPSNGINGAEWDLIISDQVSIPRGLRCNLMSFEAAPPEAPIRFGEEVGGQLMNVDSAYPLQRFVDWTNVQVSAGYALKVASDVQPLATVNEQPIIAAWQKNGWHYVIFGTDLFHSDLGLSGAFPVFMQNMLQQCVPQWNNPLAYTVTVGETSALAEPATWRVINTNKIEVNRLGPLIFIKALTPGIYYWGQGVNRGSLAANLPPGELDTAPQPIQIDTKAIPLATGFRSAQIPFGNWGLGLLPFLLCLEWFVWRGLPAKKE